VILSGQLGVETWAAEAVIELQEEFPQLHFAILTPFEDQEKNWNEAKQEKYEFLLSQADFHRSLTNKPYEAPWQFVEKNKFFLRNSDGILLVYDEE
ncbi:SLOG family protein, partial [Streptococcus pneumoniae]|nr:SLOG family protein [Streptococcus pneumoniae]